QLLQSRTRPVARTCSDYGRSGKTYRGLLRNQPAHQSGGYLVLDVPEYLLRDRKRQAEGLAEDVQRGDRRIQRMGGIAGYARILCSAALVSRAGSDRGLAADIPDCLAASRRSRLRDPRRS